MKKEKETKNACESALTPRQKLYYNIMRTNSGVLHLKGMPGMSKTSQIEAIARKLNYQFIDLRLSMLDETDIGLYPIRKKCEYNNEQIETLDFAVPMWALRSNEKPTIILFDELARASNNVRNAALQILLERRIGPFFKFNENVHMVVTDNLGDEDGTSIDEFDSALNNRLIHVKFTLTLKEWIDDFAKDRIIPEIISFLEKSPEYFYFMEKRNGEIIETYATPRTWTFLSDFLKCNYEKDLASNKEEVIKILKEVGPCYVGPSAAMAFVQYLIDTSDVDLNAYLSMSNAEAKKYISNAPRAKRSEFLTKLRDLGYPNNLNFDLNACVNIAHIIINSDLDEIFKDFFMLLTNSLSTGIKKSNLKKTEIILNEIKNERPEFYNELKNAISKI